MIITDIQKLNTPSEPAEADEAQKIIGKLEKALAASPVGGVGLAAPQIGVKKRVAIIRTEKASLNLVNPIIKDSRGLAIYRDEGCLSLPGTRVNTWRHPEVLIVDDLHPAGIVAVEFEAVVAQHEIDHLDGMLITDRDAGKKKVGRNDPCPCGAKKPDGKPVKFKKCHGR